MAHTTNLLPLASITLRRRDCATLLAATMLPAMAPAAETWPGRPIKLIVPYTAGGNSDAIARLLADHIAKAVGQPVVIENKGGAAAAIGSQAVATAPADGYTFLLAPTAVMCITPHLRKLPYSPDEFTPVALVSGAYTIVMARKGLAKDFAGMVAKAKAAPGKLTFGSSGLGTTAHITGEIVNRRTGISTLHVPYKGAAEAMNDLLGGHVDLLYGASGLAQIQKGNLEGLAIAGPRRHPELPNAPTLVELGYPIDDRSWFGLWAPAGTDQAIVNRVSAAVKELLQSPETEKQLLAFSQYSDYRDPTGFAKKIRDDSEYFKGVIREFKITLD